MVGDLVKSINRECIPQSGTLVAISHEPLRRCDVKKSKSQRYTSRMYLSALVQGIDTHDYVSPTRKRNRGMREYLETYIYANS